MLLVLAGCSSMYDNSGQQSSKPAIEGKMAEQLSRQYDEQEATAKHRPSPRRGPPGRDHEAVVRFTPSHRCRGSRKPQGQQASLCHQVPRLVAPKTEFYHNDESQCICRPFNHRVYSSPPVSHKRLPHCGRPATAAAPRRTQVLASATLSHVSDDGLDLTRITSAVPSS